MFSPDEDDDSFNLNRKTIRTGRSLEKRKSSYKNKSDEENSVKPRKLAVNKKTPKCHSLTNSLSHPGVCIKTGIAHSTPFSTPLADINISPSKERRSLNRSSKNDLQDDSLFVIASAICSTSRELVKEEKTKKKNDDAEELRVELENQISAQDSTFDINKGSRSLEIFAQCLAIDLSTEQLATHLTNCIELNAANVTAESDITSFN